MMASTPVPSHRPSASEPGPRSALSPLTPRKMTDGYLPPVPNPDPVSPPGEVTPAMTAESESDSAAKDTPPSRGASPVPPHLSTVVELESKSVSPRTATSLLPRAPSTTHVSATGHQRNPSRNSVSSPPLTHTPVFAPSSLGRPASVASNSSFAISRVPLSTAATTALVAPPMAPTISSSSASNSTQPNPHDLLENPFGEFHRRVLRKTSSQASLSPLPDPPSARRLSAGAGGEETSSISPGSSGVSVTVAGVVGGGIGKRRDSHSSSTRDREETGIVPGQTGFAALGTIGAGSKLLRGLSTRKKTPGTEGGSGGGGGKPTAMDILQRIQGGGAS